MPSLVDPTLATRLDAVAAIDSSADGKQLSSAEMKALLELLVPGAWATDLRANLEAAKAHATAGDALSSYLVATSAGGYPPDHYLDFAEDYAQSTASRLSAGAAGEPAEALRSIANLLGRWKEARPRIESLITRDANHTADAVGAQLPTLSAPALTLACRALAASDGNDALVPMLERLTGVGDGSDSERIDTRERRGHVHAQLRAALVRLKETPEAARARELRKAFPWTGSPEERRTAAEAILALAPHDAQMLQQAARALMELKRPEDTVALLDRGTPHIPGGVLPPMAAALRGKALALLGRPSEAAESYLAARACHQGRDWHGATIREALGLLAGVPEARDACLALLRAWYALGFEYTPEQAKALAPGSDLDDVLAFGKASDRATERVIYALTSGFDTLQYEGLRRAPEVRPSADLARGVGEVLRKDRSKLIDAWLDLLDQHAPILLVDLVQDGFEAAVVEALVAPTPAGARPTVTRAIAKVMTVVSVEAALELARAGDRTPLEAFIDRLAPPPKGMPRERVRETPNCLAVVDALLADGLDANAAVGGKPLLVRAAAAGSAPIVARLLAAGADPAKTDAGGATALQAAVQAALRGNWLGPAACVGQLLGEADVAPDLAAALRSGDGIGGCPALAARLEHGRPAASEALDDYPRLLGWAACHGLDEALQEALLEVVVSPPKRTNMFVPAPNEPNKVLEAWVAFRPEQVAAFVSRHAEDPKVLERLEHLRTSLCGSKGARKLGDGDLAPGTARALTAHFDTWWRLAEAAEPESMADMITSSFASYAAATPKQRQLVFEAIETAAAGEADAVFLYDKYLGDGRGAVDTLVRLIVAAGDAPDVIGRFATALDSVNVQVLREAEERLDAETLGRVARCRTRGAFTEARRRRLVWRLESVGHGAGA